jgi:glycosyltransferase involved in cell wall biosynthesis
MSRSWICCQIGAREHFAIPRALNHAERLALLITDAWVPPHHWPSALPSSIFSRLSQRFHPDLASAAVRAFPASAVRFEIQQRLSGHVGWDRTIARNRWFQKRAVGALKAIKLPAEERPTLFAYSYAARDILRYARDQGWRTLLGQIDPGPVEEDLVAQEYARHSVFRTNWHPAPPHYWQSWKEECELADRIVVNSSWSSRALQKAGIDQGKIVIMPLAYEQPRAAQGYQRTYPDRFTHERPLRVLFLGQIIIRKGIAVVLAAARLLSDRPVEFWLVGPTGLSELPKLANVHWVGPVSRDETAQYYRDADLFLFPTLSDGFGLTQLEAQAWKLPVIASQFCGDVVMDRVNGFVLPQVTGDAIAFVLRSCLDHPQMLTVLARQATQTVRGFSLATLRRDLEALDNPWPFVDRAPGAMPEPGSRFRAREDVGTLVDQER